MSSGSESTDAGKTQSSGGMSEANTSSGGKTPGTGQAPGAGLGNTLDQTPEQRVGDAGQIGQENPEIASDNVKTTKAAFSGGTKPGNIGQTQTPAETETTDYGQTETKRS